MTSRQLFYVYDPMCSWCWAYRPTLLKLEQQLAQNRIKFSKVLGGLAPDTELPMPEEQRQTIEGIWRHIHQRLGTEFNYDFWRLNEPRRSTYPACRAILVARKYSLEDEMNHAIQLAYYKNACNPSDDATLAQCAQSIGIDEVTFLEQLNAPKTRLLLEQEVQFARSIRGNSFPSWMLVEDGQSRALALDYKNEQTTLKNILSAFS